MPTTNTATLSAPVSTVSATITGWIAAVHHSGDTLVVAHASPEPCTNTVTSASTGTDASLMLRILSSLPNTCGTNPPPPATSNNPPPETSDNTVAALRPLVEHALATLGHWLNTRALQQLAGLKSQSLAPLQRRALERLSERIAETPAPARSALGTLTSRAEQQVIETRGAGAELALEQWISTSRTVPLATWLAAVPSVAQSCAIPETTGSIQQGQDWNLQALLLLQPPTCATKSSTPQ